MTHNTYMLQIVYIIRREIPKKENTTDKKYIHKYSIIKNRLDMETAGIACPSFLFVL